MKTLHQPFLKLQLDKPQGWASICNGSNREEAMLARVFDGHNAVSQPGTRT